MEAEKFLEILDVAERLKNNTRHSWTSGGRHESVAEHSWRLALMAMMCRDEYPGLDMDKVIQMCLIHDLGEAFTGDIPCFEKKSKDENREEAILEEWIASFPMPYCEEWIALLHEMNERTTDEAKLYKALDNLEAVIQHNEADLSTWLPLEYELQLTYGSDKVGFSAYTMKLKEAIDSQTHRKIEMGAGKQMDRENELTEVGSIIQEEQAKKSMPEAAALQSNTHKKAVFEKDFRLRTADFDCYRQLKPSAILDFFQDVAGNHAEELGIGYEYMLNRQLFWVLTKVKYQVLKEGTIYDRVKVKTWPLPPSRITFLREYVIENEQGEILVKGTSEWVLIHSEKRKLMPVRDLYPIPEDEFCCERMFDEKLGRVEDFKEASGDVYEVRTAFCDLDMNGHVNNTVYADMIMNALQLPKEKKVTFLQIDYHIEVKAGELLSIHFFRKNENEILVKGCDSEEREMFIGRLMLES